jgi:Na+/H+ antiporter NhaA
MTEALPFIDAAMKYLIVPAVIWVWMLHKQQGVHSTDIAVLRAEANARDQARREEREATAAQLEQIIGMLQTLNGRIDTMMTSGNGK